MAEGDAAEDLRLPQTVIGRLVKEALPPGVIISKVSYYHFRISLKILIYTWPKAVRTYLTMYRMDGQHIMIERES